LRWHKAAQLTLALSLGFELPPTLITNDPKEALDFYRTHDGQVVSKRAGYSWVTEVQSPFRRFTEVVTTRDIAHIAEVRYCPLILQRYIAKVVELRVTVVGSAVFAAEIHSQRSNHTRHDWRRYDHTRCICRPHALPESLADRCRQLVRDMGLTFGAIDLILTPDDRYVFLEINTNGQYLWIELATGLPISEAICDVLTSGRTHRAQQGERSWNESLKL
jgi:glutathione synthase/RimK-type ligase-like ATP-grasp enzyme